MLEKYLERKFIELIEKAHEGQVYKGGVPYKHHLHRVVLLLSILLEKNKESQDIGSILKAAFAHDALEDTKVSVLELSRHCNQKTISWICSLTDEEVNPPRPKYIKKLQKADEEVKLIKLSDLFDNMQTAMRRINENGLEWTKGWFFSVIEEQHNALQNEIFGKYSKTGRNLQDLCAFSFEMLIAEISRWESK